MDTIGWLPKLQGLAKGLNIKGRGHVAWSFHDINGMLRTLKVPAFYVPNCPVRLLSTTSLLQTYSEEKLEADALQMMLSGVDGDPMRASVVALVDPRDNLPSTTGYNYTDTDIPSAALNATVSVVSEANRNLSEPEKELLRWHYRLGHMDFRKVQSLLRSGVLANSASARSLHTAAAKLRYAPKCAACQFGKQTQRSSGATRTSAVRDREGVLRQDTLLPGQKVAVDHFVCSTKGRLFDSRGKSRDALMYVGGCLFVDLATNHIHVEFQSKLNTHETATAKESYEMMCRDHGVVPQSYHSDNGSSFTSKGFAEHLQKFEQVSSFAGVGAHHQNAAAERSIRTIMMIARTMMLHAAIHWPDVADACLWPMAVQHAVFLYNHVPDLSTGLSPHDLFTRTRWPQRKFHDLHVWGCPVYVLDKTISDGKKVPRWKPRSTRSVNMGLSKKHATTAPLVLNPESGYITPQFHVVFDDWFATVAAGVEELPDFNSPEWAKMFGDSAFQYPEDEFAVAPPAEGALDTIERAALRNRDTVAQAMDHYAPTTPLPVDDPETNRQSATATYPSEPATGPPGISLAPPRTGARAVVCPEGAQRGNEHGD